VAKAYRAAVDAAIDTEAGSGGATEVTQAEAIEQPTTPAPAAICYAAAQRWAAQHPGETLAQAFIAGFLLAQGVTMDAPPVTADLTQLAPDGKTARTVIAALQLFRDQVLRDAAEEIASGEWCSVSEVAALIKQLEETL
jgi:hypothetical protein